MLSLNIKIAASIILLAMLMHPMISPGALAQTCRMNATITKPDSDAFLRGQVVLLESYIVDCDENPLPGATNTIRIKHSDYPNELQYWESCFNMSEAGGTYSCYWKASANATFGWYDVRLDAQKPGFGTASAMKSAFLIGSAPELRSVSVSPKAGSPWAKFYFKVQINDADHSWNNVSLMVSKDNTTWKEIKTQRVWPQPLLSLTMADVTFTPDEEGVRYFKFISVDDVSLFTADSGDFDIEIYDCGDGTCDPDEYCMVCPSDCGYCESARIDVIDVSFDTMNVAHPAEIEATSTIECSGIHYESPYVYGVLDCVGSLAEIYLPGGLLGLAPGEELVHQLGTIQNGSSVNTTWKLITLPRIMSEEVPQSARINISASEASNSTNDTANSEVIYVIYKCGNGVCDEGESNCTCPNDCGSCEGGCGDCLGYACVNSGCACTAITGCCGNGVCEAPNETYMSCCTDCGCPSNQTCRDDSCVDERPKICVPDAIRCSGGNLQLCGGSGTDWLILAMCEHGCSETDLSCNPSGGPLDFALYALLVVLAVAAIAYLYRRKRKSGRPLTLDEALDGFYGE